MARADGDVLKAPTLEALLEALALASVGQLRARVSVPEEADPTAPLTVLAHALNLLLSDLEHRAHSEAMQTERLRTLLRHLPLGVVIAEAPEGRVVFRNEAVGRMLGDMPAPDRVEAYLDAVAAFDAEGQPLDPRRAPLARAVLRGEVVREEVLELRPAGRAPLWLSCTAAPVRDIDDTIVGGILVFEDVTERRAAREREAKLLAFQSSLLGGLSDAGLGIIVSDGRRVLEVNPAFARLMQREPASLVGLDTTELVVPEERAAGRARQEGRTGPSPSPESFRCTFLRADGTGAPAEVLAKPLRGDPPRFLALVRDLAEEERARAEVDAARRQVAHSEKLSALGSLVSGVAHEVRTPLTYLHNHLHLLDRRLERAIANGGGVDELRALQDQTRESMAAAERIARLVEDLRRFTRLRAGDRRLEPLDAAVAGAVALFEATHRGRVVLRARLEPTPVLVDTLQVQQVALNLLENAADASPAGGTIHVHARAAGDHGVFEVVDEGAGMAPEVLARAFDPFFTTKPEGTGLGLSIVKRIVESAAGEIACDTAPGKGARFTVRLPAQATI